MNATKLLLTIILLLSVFLFGCQDETPIEKGLEDFTYQSADIPINIIKPPFLDKDIPQEVFIIDAQKDEEIVTKSGSKIKLKKNSLVSLNGEQVTGTVKIEYRDFHNPMEIFFSGIPMEYDSNGTKLTFETAGMFEIKAYQNNQKLKLKDKNNIDIALVSTSNESRFNFYNLEESTGVWTQEVIQMEIKTEALNTQGSKEENNEILKPIKHDKAFYAFDVDLNKEEYPELSAYDGTMFEVKEKKSFDPIYYNVQWDKAEIKKIKKGHYKLELFKEDTSITVFVKPVIKTEKYNSAIAKYNKQINDRESKKEVKSEFDLYTSQIISYNSAMSSQYEIVRQFQINGFGIYNVDQPKVNPNGDIEEIIVEINGKNKTINNTSYYLVNLNQNSLISLYNKPKYFKNADNVLWAIIDNKEIIIIPSSQIKTMEDKTLYAKLYPIEQGIALLNEMIAIR